MFVNNNNTLVAFIWMESSNMLLTTIIIFNPLKKKKKSHRITKISSVRSIGKCLVLDIASGSNSNEESWY